MALTIVQHPTDQESFYDCAYTRLPYLISGSTDTSQPQFRYVMDIFESGSSDLVHRTTQPINPAGVAVFDPSRIFQGQLSYQNDWTVTGISESISSSRVYDVKFTTQYGTSDSSSITVQSYQASHSIGIISATRDLNLQDNPKITQGRLDVFDTGWAFPGINFEVATNQGELFVDCVLSNNPYLMQLERDTLSPSSVVALPLPNQPPLVKYDDYYTVSFLSNGSYAINEAGLNVTIYSGSTSVATSNLSINNKRGVITYGVGPQNLINLDPSLGFMTGSNTWTTYACTFSFRPFPGSTSGYSTTFDFANEDTIKNGLPLGRDKTIPQPVNICDNKTQFAFINNFGVYDYYTIYNPIRKISDLKRESVNLSQFNYSNKQPNFPMIPGSEPYGRVYEISRRGQKDFYIDRQDRFIVTTDYLLQPVAQWLEELMESPQVYIRESTGFIPINITNRRVQYNNNQARNKLFQYTIEFEYANKRLSNKTSPLGQS